VITLCGYQSFLSFSSLHPAFCLFCQLLSSPQFYVWSNQSRSNAREEVKARMAYIETDIERGSFHCNVFLCPHSLCQLLTSPLFLSTLFTTRAHLSLITHLQSYPHHFLYQSRFYRSNCCYLQLNWCLVTTPRPTRRDLPTIFFLSSQPSSPPPFPSFCASQAQLIC